MHERRLVLGVVQGGREDDYAAPAPRRTVSDLPDVGPLSLEDPAVAAAADHLGLATAGPG